LNHSDKDTQKTEHFFSTEHLKADLKGRSVRGGSITMAAQGARFLLQMASMVVLARLLTPQDYGLISMVTAVTGFVSMFKDMGLSMATVQRAEINHNQISTLFWINVLLSIIVMLITAALAPVIAWFYGEPRLIWVTLALAGAFIFGGLTVQHQALLRRQMRFGYLAIIRIVSMLIGIIVGIIAALLGLRYWALVLMIVVTSMTNSIGVWIASPWRPGPPVRKSGVRKMLTFGGHLTGFSFLNYFARNADNVLIGKFWGAGALGLYAKAYGLLMLPISQIREPLNSVSLPALCVIQNDPVKFKKYYVKLVMTISFFSMPLIIFLAICSKNIIIFFLGKQWLGASGIFQILAFAAFIQPPLTTKGCVMLSCGLSGRYFKFGVYNSIIIVLSFLSGIHWGALGVAYAYTIVNWLVIIPSLWYCYQFTPINVRDFFHAVSKPFSASIVMSLPVLLTQSYMEHQPVVVSLSVCLLIGLLSYLLIWLIMPEGKSILYEYCSYRKLIFEKV
jgi:O-antigen/teichoic acid export membrane protein